MAQSRQKSYVDERRKDLEFQEGETVFLKVSPSKGIMRFGKKGKLSSKYIGPFKILKRVGSMAYELALPSKLLHVYKVFHISILQKYVQDPSHVLEYELLQVQEELLYEEQLVQILDRKE